MFNLLPDIDKRALRKEYRKRLVVWARFPCLTTILVAAAFEVPRYYLYRTAMIDAMARMAAVDSGPLLEAAIAFDKEIMEVNNLVKISDLYKNLSAYGIVSQALEKKPRNVSVQDFSYTRGADQFTVVLRGVAPDRTSLQSLKSVFEQGSLFDSVEVPLSDFARNKDLNFTLTAQGKI